jgi:hypothetical protein
VIVAPFAGRAFERGKQLGRDFLLRHAQALEVARISGRGPQAYDIAGIDGQHRFERGIEKAAMHGGRRRPQLMYRLFALRLCGCKDESGTETDAERI